MKGLKEESMDLGQRGLREAWESVMEDEEMELTTTT